MDRKLVILGIPWDVDTEGLRDYMRKFGEIEDCIVMKERLMGYSRGFGYVTFTMEKDAKTVLSSEHMLGNRMLEVKVATPKDHATKAHRGIGFITFASSGCNRFCHPLEDAGIGPSYVMSYPVPEPFRDCLGPMHSYSRMYANLDFPHWGYGLGGGRPSRADIRYQPY